MGLNTRNTAYLLEVRGEGRLVNVLQFPQLAIFLPCTMVVGRTGARCAEMHKAGDQCGVGFCVMWLPAFMVEVWRCLGQSFACWLCSYLPGGCWNMGQPGVHAAEQHMTILETKQV